MKKFIVLLVLLSTNAYAADNQGIKACLELYNYSPEKFDTFDWSKPARCNSDYLANKEKQRIAELRKFIKERPWYKGKNWQWEDCAKDNRCTNTYSWWSLKEK